MSFKIEKNQWKQVRLDDIVEWYQKDIPNNKQILLDIENYITAEHIESDVIKITRSGLVKSGKKGPTITKHYQKGDLLLSTRSVALRKASITQNEGVTGEKLLVLRPKKNSELIVELFPFIFKSSHFWNFAQNSAAGSVNKFTSWTKIKEYQFLLPPKDQQAKIAKLLWAMDDVVEKEKEVYTKIESLFLSVSKNVFSESAGEQKLLKEVSEVIMGQSPLGKTYNENGDGFAFLQGNAEFGDRYPKNKKFTTSPKKIAPNNSILISVRAPVGDLNIANQDYCIGRGLAAIVVEDSNFREYIYNFLKYSEYELNKHSSGSTFKAINKDKLSTLKLVVPNNGNVQNSVGLFKRLSETMGKSKNQFNQSKQLQKTLINEIFSV